MPMKFWKPLHPRIELDIVEDEEEEGGDTSSTLKQGPVTIHSLTLLQGIPPIRASRTQ